MKYAELKLKQEKEFNEFVEKAMFFAFSGEQFVKGMNKLNLDAEKDLDKIVKTIGGGFCLKEKAEELANITNRFAEEIQEQVDADKNGDGFIYSMFLYELRNHEYGYTGDYEDTLDALDLTIEDIQKNPNLLTGFNKARKTVMAEGD